jgi:hypothetical protein
VARGSRLPDDGKRVGRSVGGVLRDGVYPFLESMAAAHASANSLWDQAAYITDDASLQHRLARILATSPHPLSRTQLVGRLCPDGTDTERRGLMRELESVFEERSSVSPASKRHSELGRAGVDSGGFGEVHDLLDISTQTSYQHLRAVIDSRQVRE